MLLLPCDRDALISLLPKGGQVAEIGVSQGEFSRTIWDLSQPEELHLVDPWHHQERSDYQGDPGNAAESVQQANYEKVIQDFGIEIAAGKAYVHRLFSPSATSIFTPHSLDWIYLDAVHSCDAVKADLWAWAPKVKEDGYILGHDYTNHQAAQQMGFGVVEAVTEFVRWQKWFFVALTNEAYPTYLLARTAEAMNAMEARILSSLRYVVRLLHFPYGLAYQDSLLFGPSLKAPLRYDDGHFMHCPSFGTSGGKDGR